jgi:hypothetical protein
METLDNVFARSAGIKVVASLGEEYLLWVNSVPKMNRNFANRKCVYYFYSIQFSIRRVLIIASPSEKKPQG